MLLQRQHCPESQGEQRRGRERRQRAIAGGLETVTRSNIHDEVTETRCEMLEETPAQPEQDVGADPTPSKARELGISGRSIGKRQKPPGQQRHPNQGYRDSRRTMHDRRHHCHRRPVNRRVWR